MLRTRPPLVLRPVRLACIRPAASVHPETGSNSPLYTLPNNAPRRLLPVITPFGASRLAGRLGLVGVAVSAQSTAKQHPCLSGSFGLDLLQVHP